VNQIQLLVGGRSVRFLRAPDSRYSSEVDGEPRPIRSRLTQGYVSEGGGSLPEPPPWNVAATADLAPLLECLAEKADPVEQRGATVFEVAVQWGHFRQNRFTTVSIAIAADGAVEIDMRVATQDDSYY